MAGDFCYVQPGTVKFRLRSCRGKCDYQLLDTGRLEKCYFGKMDQLVFHFVRGDGTSAQWHSVLNSCQYVCMYVMYVCNVCMYVMYVCMYVYMYVCMYREP